VLPLPATNRAVSTLRTTGNAKHVRVPAPLLTLLGWRLGEELMCIVVPDGTLRVLTLEQHYQERLAADRVTRSREEVAAHA
jgi:antitoxin component of MazEF toxin-antitoxin module